jgi:hypothetical protein
MIVEDEGGQSALSETVQQGKTARRVGAWLWIKSGESGCAGVGDVRAFSQIPGTRFPSGRLTFTAGLRQISVA